MCPSGDLLDSDMWVSLVENARNRVTPRGIALFYEQMLCHMVWHQR
jgi:hypothetical protein